MPYVDYYPKSSELLKAELDCLDFLRYQPAFKLHHHHFFKAVHRYYERNKATKQFEFASWLDLQHDELSSVADQRANLRVVIACQIFAIDDQVDNASYCLCVVERGSNQLWRKFHFDVLSSEQKQRRQAHPRFHLQYGGKPLKKVFQSAGIDESEIDRVFPKLSEPRIAMPPMSLALLIDLVLREFPDPRLHNFRSANGWSKLIHVHEDLILKPFYQHCINTMSAGKKRKTLSERNYV